MYAYVTLLTSQAYLPGALVLAKSLKQTNTPFAVALLISKEGFTEDSLRILYTAFDKVIPVDNIESVSLDNLKLLGRPDLVSTFTKLHCWNPDMLPYDRICFMDADTLVIRNIDAIFDYVAGESVVFAAAPDVGWPDCFNSGVFVTKPSLELYEALKSYAAEHGSFDGGDQGVLNSFFSSWSREPTVNPRTSRLPFTFNVTPSAFYSYLPAFEHFASDISVIHFIGESKPWKWSRFIDGRVIPRGDTPSQTLSLLQKWWDVFDQYSIHSLLNGFTLDRDWSLYQTPHHQDGDSHHHARAFSSEQIQRTVLETQLEFASYRATWDRRESRGAVSSKSSSSKVRSPVKQSTSPTKESPTKQPKPDNLKAASGEYKVGWNQTELKGQNITKFGADTSIQYKDDSVDLVSDQVTPTQPRKQPPAKSEVPPKPSVPKPVNGVSAASVSQPKPTPKPAANGTSTTNPKIAKRK